MIDMETTDTKVQTPKTIDITTSNDLFEGADPIGLLPEVSARAYLETLRERVGELYPKARVFLRWAPTRTEPADILTLPRVEKAEERLLEMAEELKTERSVWVRHDETIRAALSS